MSKEAVIGISDHWGWAVLMTVASDGTLLDRRRVELIDKGLPAYPYHHDAQGLPSTEAEQLVKRVTAAVELQANQVLAAMDREFQARIAGIALRKCPPLPATIAERLNDYFAQNNADSVMYRQALAHAAAARGWRVDWFEARQVFAAASAVLQVADVEDHFKQVKHAIGSPWTKDHKLAMAAAIAGVGPGKCIA